MKELRVVAWIVLICFLPLLVNAGPPAGQKVGVLWVSKSGMADRVARGFMHRMSELAPQTDMEFQMALADDETAQPVYERFQAEKDAVIFLRSHGAKWLAAHDPEVPSFIGAANNPERLGVVADMNHPDGLITGVTYYLPVARQFDLYRRLFPDMRSVALLTMTGHPSSPIEAEETRATCEELGLTCRVVESATKSDLVTAVKSLKDEVDLLILGNQNLLIDNSAVVATIAGQTPVMSYSEKPVGKGALGGLVPDDEKLGAMLAESVCEVLGGRSVAEVPVKTDPEPRFLIDRRRMVALGIELSPELQAMATDY